MINKLTGEQLTLVKCCRLQGCQLLPPWIITDLIDRETKSIVYSDCDHKEADCHAATDI